MYSGQVTCLDTYNPIVLKLFQLFQGFGLKNSLVGYRFNDIAGQLENIVYLELLSRGYQVAIGKIKELEVDFIATKNGFIHG